MRLPRTHPSQTPKTPAAQLRAAMLAALNGKTPDQDHAGKPLQSLQAVQPLQPIAAGTR